jgi:mono/diheme cytochrome c family protein
MGNFNIPKWAWLVLPFVGFGLIFVLNMYAFRAESQGKRLYDLHCSSCHFPNGEGLKQLIPPLAKADYMLENAQKIACIIRNGQNGAVKVNGIIYNQPMPANLTVTEIEITNIVNYIQNNWGNKAPERTFQQIQRELRECKE